MLFRPSPGLGNYGYGVFLILDVVLDIGGVPHALGSVTAVFNGVPSCYLPYRRFRRYAAAPPSIPLAALTGSKIRRTYGSRRGYDGSLRANASRNREPGARRQPIARGDASRRRAKPRG